MKSILIANKFSISVLPELLYYCKRIYFLNRKFVVNIEYNVGRKTVTFWNKLSITLRRLKYFANMKIQLFPTKCSLKLRKY